MQAIKTGVNVKNLALGLVVMLFGLGLAAAAFFGGFTLNAFRLPLPSWSAYVLAAVALVMGAAFSVLATRAEKCGSCGGDLKYGEAYFPLEAETQVLRSVKDINPAYLAGLPKVPKRQMKTALQMSYCTRCGEVGEIGASKWENFQQHDLAVPRVAIGPNVKVLADIVREHEAWRNE